MSLQIQIKQLCPYVQDPLEECYCAKLDSLSMASDVFSLLFNARE